MKKFLGIIEDKLIPKLDRNFSNQEKTLIDNFIFSILKKDKDSNISYVKTKIYNDPDSFTTEEITKSINLWEEDVRFAFYKVYMVGKKFIDNDQNMQAWGFKFPPGKEKPKALHGIRFEGEASLDLFDTGFIGSDNKPAIRNTIQMNIGLEYASESFLSEKTLKNLEKDFFKKIRDAIVKPKRK